MWREQILLDVVIAQSFETECEYLYTFWAKLKMINNISLFRNLRLQSSPLHHDSTYSQWSISPKMRTYFGTSEEPTLDINRNDTILHQFVNKQRVWFAGLKRSVSLTVCWPYVIIISWTVRFKGMRTTQVLIATCWVIINVSYFTHMRTSCRRCIFSSMN